MDVRRAYDAVAATYDCDYDGWGARVEDSFVRGLLEPVLREPVLDIATGTGLLFDWFPQVRGEGYDISREMVQVAQAKHPNRWFEVAEARIYTPFYAARTVTCLFGGLSYVPPTQAVEVVHRSLEHGGHFFVMLNGPLHNNSETLKRRSMRVERWTYTRNQALKAFSAKFSEVQVRSAFRLPRVSVKACMVESWALSRFAPWLANFQIVTGRKL